MSRIGWRGPATVGSMAPMTDQQQGRGDWWCGRCAENRPRYLVAYRNGGRFYDCARCVAELRARAEDAAAISEISEIR